MKRYDSRLFWGGLLIFMGLVFLLQSLNIIILNAIWPFMFAAPGVLFLLTFLRRPRESWWAIIPGFTLLGLAAVTGIELLFPETSVGNLGGAIFLGSIGLSFLLVYIATGAQQWWALIPAGTLMTLALISVTENYLNDSALAGLLMSGLGLTFGAVYILPTPQGRMKWAAIPAVILFSIGALGIVATTQLINYIWPVALILLGGYLIFRRNTEV